jgi:hypothetical protein
MKEPTNEINESTRLPLKLVIPMVALAITIVGIGIRQIAQVDDLRKDISQLREDLVRYNELAWTVMDMKTWALEWQVSNPAHKVPPVREPIHLSSPSRATAGQPSMSSQVSAEPRH